MASTGAEQRGRQIRIYDRSSSVVFLKTKEAFGGLSNMAGGFPLIVNGIRIRTSEALYQACRFPHLPDVQRLIISQRSPMTAKMRGKPYRQESRRDWNWVRVRIMQWCLRVKLAQNWTAFSALLLDTGDRAIVEQSRRDDYWGAKAVDGRTLVGMNVLGRLLMELRELVKAERDQNLRKVEPLSIVDFRLMGNPIGLITDPMPAGSTANLSTRQALVGVVETADRGLSFGAREPTALLRERPTAYLYAAYKDSGIRTLEKVPTHWAVRRLKNVCEVRVSNVDKRSREGERPIRLCNYVDVYKAGRIRSEMSFMRATAGSDDIERFRLRSGDVVITKDSEAWDDIGVPAFVEDLDNDVVCGYHLALLRPSSGCVTGEYLFRAVQSSAVAYQFHVRANGVTRFGLTHNAIGSMRLPVPPLNEQAEIVRVLNYVDRRIQRYIHAKERLIALLEEQKQAIIQEAVRGGFDVQTELPYPAYKDSGVEWLGAVPAHWDVAALRHRYTQSLGKMLDSKEITGDYSLPYLRNIDVQWDAINTEDLPAMDIAPEEYDRYTLREGDLLVCEGGEVGRCALWSGELTECGFQKALHRLRPVNADRDVPRYMYYALRAAARGEAFGDGHVSTITHLTGEKLRAHRFPFPPLAEQRSVVGFLDAALQKSDLAVSSLSQQTELLYGYRARLLVDVVTGKLDVRSWATRRADRDVVDVDGDVGSGWAGSRHGAEEGRPMASVVDAQHPAIGPGHGVCGGE